MEVLSKAFHSRVKFSQIRGLELIFPVNMDLFFPAIHRSILLILLSGKTKVYCLYYVCTSQVLVPEVKKPQYFLK